MEYSAIHNGFILTQDDLKRFSNHLKYTMKEIRKATGTPLTKRKRDAPMDRIDLIERGLLDAAKSIGVNMGSEWGHELDLSEPDNA